MTATQALGNGSRRRVQLAALSGPQRRLVLALVAAGREAEASRQTPNEGTARASETPRAVQEVRRRDRRSSPSA